jgi:hypothetical protein
LRSGSAGRPDARRAERLSGKRRPKKRMPAAERQRESITGWIGFLPRRKPADVGLVGYLATAEWDCQNQRDKLDAGRKAVQTDPAMKKHPSAAEYGEQGR